MFQGSALSKNRQGLDVIAVRDLAAQLFVDQLEFEPFCRTDSAFRSQGSAEHDSAVVKAALAAVVAFNLLEG